ncbi:TCF25-Rqc1 [Babesia duncani]|uniref:TCF25-Rqc1 n=1 Tax=Babesia duncani TaxID=323732 RepID=A0AAD9PNL3_9APIC|nr:TCF25-Rqc1 [Babesia duncani]
MSRRQIQKLLREKQDTLEAQQQHKIPHVTLNSPTFSFADYSPTDHSSDESQDEPSPRPSPPKKAQQPLPKKKSSSAEWDLLEKYQQENILEPVPPPVELPMHFLASTPRDFWYPCTIDSDSKRLKLNMTRRSKAARTRNWVIPIDCPMHAKRLHAEASEQLRMTMQRIDNRDLFNVEYTRQYSEIERLCAIAIESQDPTFLFNLLESNPFHLELLCRASCIRTLTNAHEEAFRTVVLAVKEIQTIFPPQFNPFTLSARPNVSFVHFLPFSGMAPEFASGEFNSVSVALAVHDFSRAPGSMEECFGYWQVVNCTRLSK